MKFIVLLSVCLIVSYVYGDIYDDWEEFKMKYHKKYPSFKEEQKRFEIFKETKRMVDEHNILYDEHKTTWKMGIDQYSDLTKEEFEKIRMGYGIKYRPKV